MKKQELSVISQVEEKELVNYLDNLGLTSKLTEKEKSTYINIAKAFGLNPFKREIHVSKYGENLSIITGYEVYIKRAERTGQLDGWNAVTSGSVATGDLKATVTIYRKDRSHPFIWEALYDECVQKTRDGKITKFWEKAAFMTKKVAISQGFRLCFSDELAGMPYTADEMPDKEVYEDIQHEEVKLSLPKITSKQFENLSKRIAKGEEGVLDKAKQMFDLSEEEITTLEGIEIVKETIEILDENAK